MVVKKKFNVEIVGQDGSIFVGVFDNTEISKGVFKKNDILYDGEFIATIQNSDFDNFKGSVIYPNGDVYVGNILNYQRNGNGILTTEDATYECNWIDDKKHGKGYMTKDGVRKEIVWNWDNEWGEEITIKCPICSEESTFRIEKCRIHQSYIKSDEICQICYENPCNINIPCQHRYCESCIKHVVEFNAKNSSNINA